MTVTLDLKDAGNGPEMTKSELIAELAADNPHLRTADAESIVNALLDGIANALARGDRVELRQFGTFTVRRRRARTGRNPRNGQAVPVEEKLMPFFTAGTGLRERVNGGIPSRRRGQKKPARLETGQSSDGDSSNVTGQTAGTGSSG